MAMIRRNLHSAPVQPHNRRFSMKLVTVLSTAAFVLVPAVALAEEPGSPKDEPGVVQKAIGTMTGRSSATKEGAQSGDKDSNAQSAGSTNYPDFGAIKKADK
jgi:hypothetical protein